jgi:Flp pilus assembly protein CpaB
MFSTLGAFRQTTGPSFSIPLGFVGIAVNLTDVNSVLGSVQPGDAVDLMASYVPTTNSKLSGIPTSYPPQTQYVLNNLKVIGVGGPPPVANSTTGSTTTTQTSTVTGGSLLLLARYQEALEIQHLKDFGWQISVVLRSAKEPTIPHFRTLPVTDRWYFAKLANPFKRNPGY